MRILIINLRIGTGSVGRIVSDLYEGIVKNGDICKVAYARGGTGNIPVQDTIRICTEQEVRKHALLTRIFGNTAFYSKKSTENFLRKIEKFNPDIVHLHGVYGYYIHMGVLFEYLHKKNIKVVSTLHSCWDFTGHCCYFSYSECNQWKSGCESCKQKKTYPRSSFLDNTNKNFERKKNLYNQLEKCYIITPSKWLADLAKDSFLNKHKISIIPNGINTGIFRPRYDVDNLYTKYSIEKNKVVVLCVANNWEDRKGFDDIIELSKYIDESIQIVVVGVNKKEKKCLPSNIIGITKTEDANELAKLYTIATVFLNPTYEDNYPTVNLEALACGTPVVTYDTGGSGEIIKKTGKGIIVSKKSYSDIIDYIKKVRATLGDKSIQVEEYKYLIRKQEMCKEYIELYERINMDEN